MVESNDVHTETRLHGCVLVKVVEHHVGVGVSFECDDHAVGVPGRKVIDFTDAVELAGVDEILDLHGDLADRGLVRQLRDHDLLRPFSVLRDLGDGTLTNGTATGAISVNETLTTEDLSASGEVRTLDEL